MSESTDGMRQFQSIKRVLAGEITEVVPAGCYVQEANGDGILRIYPPKMTERYMPVVGDFWVVYDDGYQAISPRAPFLAGYVAMRAEIIARACHEVNRAICEAAGDTSQKPWAAADQWQRDSAIRGVDFALSNPNASADAQHNAWMADKVADGWVYGAVKDAVSKTHPCIVPYAELPFEQRVKDHAFRAVVAAMI